MIKIETIQDINNNNVLLFGVTFELFNDETYVMARGIASQNKRSAIRKGEIFMLKNRKLACETPQELTHNFCIEGLSEMPSLIAFKEVNY